MDVQIQRPYYIVALSLASIVGAFVLTVDYLVPWESELGQPNFEGASVMAMYAWPPLIAGRNTGERKAHGVGEW